MSSDFERFNFDIAIRPAISRNHSRHCFAFSLASMVAVLYLQHVGQERVVRAIRRGPRISEYLTRNVEYIRQLHVVRLISAEYPTGSWDWFAVACSVPLRTLKHILGRCRSLWLGATFGDYLLIVDYYLTWKVGSRWLSSSFWLFFLYLVYYHHVNFQVLALQSHYFFHFSHRRVTKSSLFPHFVEQHEP